MGFCKASCASVRSKSRLCVPPGDINLSLSLSTFSDNILPTVQLVVGYERLGRLTPNWACRAVISMQGRCSLPGGGGLGGRPGRRKQIFCCIENPVWECSILNIADKYKEKYFYVCNLKFDWFSKKDHCVLSLTRVFVDSGYMFLF